MTIPTPELLPCPFCGGAPKLAESAIPREWACRIRCACGVERFGLNEWGEFEAKAEAIAAWNRRAPSEPDQAPAAIPVAWLHPTGGWSDTDRDAVADHCWKDGPQPQPLYSAATVAALTARAEKAERDYNHECNRHDLTKRRAETAEARLAATDPKVEAPVSDAARDVLTERKRQVEDEGWTPEHDDKHQANELALAAACYAAPYVFTNRYLRVPNGAVIAPSAWPWSGEWWKRTGDTRRDLVKAGALILAEIERLDRLASLRSSQEG